MEILKRGSDPEIMVCIGDTHTGHQFAACPPRGFVTDGKNLSLPNPVQKAINEHLAAFIGRIEELTSARGKTFGITHAGDWIEGHHHRAKDAISANINDQQENCVETWKPLIGKAEWLRCSRGTPAHAGEDSEHEEYIARTLGAEPDALGRYTQAINRFFWQGNLVHLAHHIGTTGTSTRRATGPWGEIGELMYAASEVESRAPDIVLRGHRHVEHVAGEGSSRGMRWTAVNPPWVGPSGFAVKVRGGRTGNPRVGGVVFEKLKDGRTLGWCETYFLKPTWEVED